MLSKLPSSHLFKRASSDGAEICHSNLSNAINLPSIDGLERIYVVGRVLYPHKAVIAAGPPPLNTPSTTSASTTRNVSTKTALLLESSPVYHTIISCQAPLENVFLTWESSKQASNDFGTMPLDPFSDADNFVHLFGVLQQLHQHDIVHSDIRLPNIVFSPPPPSSSQSQSPSQSSSPSHPMMSLVDLEYGLPKAQLDANRELVDSLYQHLKTTQSFRWFTDIASTLLDVFQPPSRSLFECSVWQMYKFCDYYSLIRSFFAPFFEKWDGNGGRAVCEPKATVSQHDMARFHSVILLVADFLFQISQPQPTHAPADVSQDAKQQRDKNNNGGGQPVAAGASSSCPETAPASSTATATQSPESPSTPTTTSDTKSELAREFFIKMSELVNSSDNSPQPHATTTTIPMAMTGQEGNVLPL